MAYILLVNSFPRETKAIFFAADWLKNFQPGGYVMEKTREGEKH
jgi:hypothetical protein